MFIADYQTKQRDCAIRWNLFNPENYIKDKVVLDIGCAQGWFVEKSLECGAKRAIGIDKEDYNWHRGEYYITSAELADIEADVAFLLSTAVDIKAAEYLRNSGIKTVFFEPFLDSENKSRWDEDEWLQRFREVGYDFYQVGVSDRGRSLYILKQTGVHMITRDGLKYANKPNVSDHELDFYNAFHSFTDYVLPHQLDENDLILPWAETTLRLSGNISHLDGIQEAINWLHALGVVHGDIRISNIVVHHGKPYLIDFSWWRYGNPDEDSGINNLKNRRGFDYIKGAVLSGKVRYLE